MEDSKTTPTPIQHKFQAHLNEPTVNEPCRELIEALTYLSQLSRPDITYATSNLVPNF